MMDPVRLAARMLLALNLIAILLLAKDVRGPLAATHGPDGKASLALLAIGAGVMIPFALVGAPGPAGVAVALGLMLVGAVAVRAAIVQMPHRLAHVRTGAGADGPSGARG
jgi:hypothetical protein